MNPFTSAIDAQAGPLGENILIACIKDWLGTSSPPAPRGIGDDCCNSASKKQTNPANDYGSDRLFKAFR